MSLPGISRATNKCNIQIKNSYACLPPVALCYDEQLTQPCGCEHIITMDV